MSKKIYQIFVVITIIVGMTVSMPVHSDKFYACHQRCKYATVQNIEDLCDGLSHSKRKICVSQQNTIKDDCDSCCDYYPNTSSACMQYAGECEPNCVTQF